MLILEVWKNQPGKFFCLATKDGAGKFKEYFFAPDEFGSVRKFLKDNDDKDIYWCPHGFNRRARQKTEACLPNLLYADLDFADPTGEVFKGLKPTIVIESSPGRFVGLWELNEPMDESVNRRLTYFVDADHGGWDITQLFRVPGTINYKYKTRPKVRTLWTDGPKYSLKKILRKLPEEEEMDGEILSAKEVFEEYGKKLPHWVRKELLAKKIIGKADRSEMLWKLENACVEAGMSVDEAIAVIKPSVWNKFSGRRTEDFHLRRELSKIIDHQFRQKPTGRYAYKHKSDEEESREEKADARRFNFTAINDIEEEEIDWLWWPYLAKRQLTILEGDPGLGKSYLAQMAAAKIAAGERIPSIRKGQPKIKGAVVYFDLENDARAVTKPRLRMNGYGNLKNYYPVEEPFSIDDDDAMEEIYETLEQIKPRLIVFDTLNTYIGKADTHKASETAQAMGIFKKLAMDFDCAVLVLRHLVKSSGAAINAGQGSMSFTGSARIVLSCGVDPDDSDTKVMTVTKTNLSVKPKEGLLFRIDGKRNDESEFVWDGFKELTSQEIIDAARDLRKTGATGSHMQDAMEFLESTIKNTAVEVEKIMRMAEKRSVDLKMVERAADKMNVIRKKKAGKTTWMLKVSEPVDDDDD